MRIGEIVSQLKLGKLALPALLRGYVWNREQVKKLMNSLYRGYPVGGLLFWEPVMEVPLMPNETFENKRARLILDGQQRITSLYGLFTGTPPTFFEGDANTFTNLYFNLSDERFEFYSPVKMRDDESMWVNVTELLKDGVGTFLTKARNNESIIQNVEKLSKLDQIRNIEIPDQVVTDKPLEVIAEIFNNINSSGTTLSEGDLALAKLASQWPDAKAALKDYLSCVSKVGYDCFDIEWILRSATVFLTNKPYFSELFRYPLWDIQEAIVDVESQMDLILKEMGSRLGLDHGRVITSKYSISIMAACLKKFGKLDDHDWNKLLYWYVHTFLWGRYSGSLESVMTQDLTALESGGIDGLIEQMRQSRGGGLAITADDFSGGNTQAQFYPLLYLLTRIGNEKDWGTGGTLSDSSLLDVGNCRDFLKERCVLLAQAANDLLESLYNSKDGTDVHDYVSTPRSISTTEMKDSE